jgi:predicted O-methyltransferase YrrM
MPGREELWKHLHSPLRPQLVYVAAKLGLADILRGGRVARGEELVRDTGADAQALPRVLRGLVMIGILCEDEEGRFSLTPQGELLQSDRPDSIRDAAIVNGELLAAWSGLLHTVQTGEPAFDYVFGSGLFEYLANKPELGKSFNQYMAKMTGRIAEAVVTAYDFSSFRNVVDVGGGSGALLAAIMSRNPLTRGILFDLPNAFDNARENLAIAPYLERCELIAGDFLESIPQGGDAYVLQLVLHDWDDARAALILRNCRQAMSAPGRLFIIERLMTGGSRRASALIEGDLDMLVLTAGRERTESEIRGLCSSEGFEVINVILMNDSWGIIENVPVS